MFVVVVVVVDVFVSLHLALNFITFALHRHFFVVVVRLHIILCECVFLSLFMLTPKKIRSESGNLSSGEMQNEICAENTKNKRCIEQYTKVDCERLKCDARLLGCKLKAEKN